MFSHLSALDLAVNYIIYLIIYLLFTKLFSFFIFKYSGVYSGVFTMPRCTMHCRHTVVRSCVSLSVRRYVISCIYLHER